MTTLIDKTLADLARALLAHHGATSGQLAMNLLELPAFGLIPKPDDVTERELVVCAALVELFAARRGEAAPDWVHAVGAWPEPIYLMGGYEKRFPKSAARWRREAPEPLRKRNVFAPAEFMTFV